MAEPVSVQGGLPCAKEVIDNRNLLVAAMACMVEGGILLYHGEPTEEERDEWLKLTKPVADLAARIQKRISGGG